MNKIKKTFDLLSLISVLYLLNVSVGKQCKTAEASISGKALMGYTFKSLAVRAPFECQVLCENTFHCQSYNFFLPRKICELNNRTKEARPRNFVTDEDRFYVRSWPNRVSLGTIPELSAESCMEIVSSEEEKVVSGLYWLNFRELGIIKVYCDFTRARHGWNLIARFSNTDTRHWMLDSGHWWYDRREAFGETTDPSGNTDMISPLFWLLNGSDFKITRSDDSEHTALLQTTDNCLGGHTFRSKVTNYGDFRNGTIWPNARCLGTCKVQYDGQYQITDGFVRASCNGSLQAADKVGFWCEIGWSGSVIMIGGAGGACGTTYHGIGITTAKEASFSEENGRAEDDFGNSPWGSSERSYSLNLWIR